MEDTVQFKIPALKYYDECMYCKAETLFRLTCDNNKAICLGCLVPIYHEHQNCVVKTFHRK